MEESQKMKIVATVEARMGSSRLPGKVLLPAGGVPLLGHLISRLRKVELIDEIVLATTSEPGDDILEKWANQHQILCFRGSSSDVMGRVLQAAKSVQGEIIVEITGDCPIIDPDIVELAIQTFLANSAEYVSNALVRSYPVGMDVQVFHLETLERSYGQTSDALDYEHVTRHIRRNPDEFKLLNLIAPERLRWPELGLTLDEIGDYKLIKYLVEHFEGSSNFSCGDIIILLRERPQLLEMNDSVTRKGMG